MQNTQRQRPEKGSKGEQSNESSAKLTTEEQWSRYGLQRMTTQNHDELIACALNGKVLVWFYASYCTHCEQVSYSFMAAAKELQGEALCVCVDGPTEPSLRDKYGVRVYPTIKLIKNGVDIAKFPPEAERTVFSFLCFVRDDGDLKNVRQSHGLALWLRALSKWKVLRTEQNLSVQRKFNTMVMKFKALGCMDEDSCAALVRKAKELEIEPPRIIFLGGGMGAGKTSVVEKKLAQTEFMKKHGAAVVIIEADAFKMSDPVFKALSERHHNGSSITAAGAAVHSYSTQTAEELFLLAVRKRRDILFDGTLTWSPFLEQTIAMVRDCSHVYRRGPGYVRHRRTSSPTKNEGTTEKEEWIVEEKYWEVEAECVPQQPYRIELVAVTVDPHVAVLRGLSRRLETGRDVPIGAQLRSHQLFSQNFMSYVPLFDQVSLYDNNESEPVLIAQKPFSPPSSSSQEEEKALDHLEVLQRSSFGYFMDKTHIDIAANNVRELYDTKAMREHSESNWRHHWMPIVERFSNKACSLHVAAYLSCLSTTND
ncbi:putative Zeta toxin domain-containing protein, variant 2 [Balamuthia mandrillaris]